MLDVSQTKDIQMKVSEQVVQLEKENADLRSGWKNDLRVLLSLAERLNDTEVIQGAKDGLKSLAVT